MPSSALFATILSGDVSGWLGNKVTMRWASDYDSVQGFSVYAFLVGVLIAMGFVGSLDKFFSGPAMSSRALLASRMNKMFKWMLLKISMDFARYNYFFCLSLVYGFVVTISIAMLFFKSSDNFFLTKSSF